MKKNQCFNKTLMAKKKHEKVSTGSELNRVDIYTYLKGVSRELPSMFSHHNCLNSDPKKPHTLKRIQSPNTHTHPLWDRNTNQRERWSFEERKSKKEVSFSVTKLCVNKISSFLKEPNKKKVTIFLNFLFILLSLTPTQYSIQKSFFFLLFFF